MNKSARYSSLSILVGLLEACAGSSPRPSRGSVVMKVDISEEAHVRTPDYELSIGDHARIVRRNCSQPGKRSSVCTEKTVSEGVVTQILNPHYSVIRFAPGADFAEGDQVEKVTPSGDHKREGDPSR